MICDKWLHIYGNKLGTGIKCEWVDGVRENVRGEWIDDGIHGDWAWEQDGHGNCWHIWKCSKCERETQIRSNYCPNCGADMRGDKPTADEAERELIDKANKAGVSLDRDLDAYYEAMDIIQEQEREGL